MRRKLPSVAELASRYSICTVPSGKDGFRAEVRGFPGICVTGKDANEVEYQASQALRHTLALLQKHGSLAYPPAQRRVQLNLRLEETERTAIASSARQHGMTPSEFCRKAALRFASSGECP